MNYFFKPFPVPKKFAIGDRVVCGGQVCRVVAVGLKFLRLQSLEGRPLGLVKIKAVTHYDAVVDDDSPLSQFSSAVEWDARTLLKRTKR
jgi:hypothetical protein